MKCRQCGTDIADKALICFRCGTATTEAKFQPAPIRGRRRVSRIVIVVVMVIALLVLLAFLLIDSADPATGVGGGIVPLSDSSKVML